MLRAAAAQATRSPRYFGKIRPSLDGADLVAGAADALQAARHRRRRLDLHDQIDRAHVDAELERRGRDQAAQPACLQRVLDVDPLRPRPAIRGGRAPAARRRARSSARGEALGEAAAVDEDQRRACATHQLEQARMDRGPDRRARRALRRRAARDVDRLGEPRHVLDRHLDLQVAAPCARPASTMVTGRGVAVVAPRGGELVARTSSRGLVASAARAVAGARPRLRVRACTGGRAAPRRRRESARPLRAAAAWPTGRCAAAGRRRSAVEALQRERQVGAALGRHQRVDLVDDHRVDGCGTPRGRSTSAAGTATPAS